ncbi:MAG: nucleotidyltransferase domain-containing protein [Gracilimonas sp.]|jgi:predicted nucleotidyltransferase|nr:nucleotidyltransferase domain-containing protein [Gracilimonas sp.]
MSISEKNIRIVNKILKKHFPEAQVIVFGSRAFGTNKTYSDLDLAIYFDNHEITSMSLANATQDFIESDLPFSVDLVNLKKVDSNLKAQIINEGKDWEIFASLPV